MCFNKEKGFNREDAEKVCDYLTHIRYLGHHRGAIWAPNPLAPLLKIVNNSCIIIIGLLFCPFQINCFNIHQVIGS